ncbi:hypothetical protein SAMN04489725_1184 [Alicyclobacillus hesperidum]|uniref:Uncharacterized protein n=1 Tax=Alicyclobacillus hesperidum TaxID=89784 RepID=A0A1H2X349_9BACL|nr:hypothetical protein SAMN04489725_1184 [Alicyclobacillus hesperidum]
MMMLTKAIRQANELRSRGWLTCHPLEILALVC